MILSDVLEHIKQPSELLCEISRIMKDDGRLVLNSPFMYWTHGSPYDYFRYTSSDLFTVGFLS